jgi:arginase
MVATQPSGGADAVEHRHVQVEHDRVRVEIVGELDRLEAVERAPDHGQLGLFVDQRLQGLEEGAVVVCDQDADGRLIRARVIHLIGNASLDAMVAQGPTDPVAVIGAPLDLGAGRRGVDMGPSAIRYAGLEPRIEELGRRCVDWGDVVTAVAEASAVGDERVRFLPQIKETCERIAELVAKAVDEGLVPLVLGGDHSVALGTLGGLARASGKGGVLWLDAHGDLNRPDTSPTGNVHGMPLAAALGLGGAEFESEAYPLPALERSRVALFGVRSLDPAERELLAEIDALVFTMSDLDRVGVEPAMREALQHVAGPGFVHVSLDLDVLDPEVAPGVGTPVRGGLSYREAHLALELVAESGLVRSFEVVEVNPILDRENQTAKLAVELVASALGARIL